MEREAREKKLGKKRPGMQAILWGQPSCFMGPRDHMKTRISHSGAKAQYNGDATEILLCRILVFM